MSDAIAEYKYQPQEPIKNKNNLVSLIKITDLGSMMPSHVNEDWLRKAALVASNKNPTLWKCTQESWMLALSNAASLGLDITGVLRQAYLVPFNNKVKLGGGKEVWLQQVQYMLGYAGLAQLTRQTGLIKRIEANDVCEHDHFVFQEGSDWRLEYRRLINGDRGKMIGAYALVEFMDGGFQAKFLDRDKIERIRAKSKLKDGIPWTQHSDEMYAKTAFKNLSKWLPMSGEREHEDRLKRAIEIDDSQFNFGDDVIDGELVDAAVTAEDVVSAAEG